MGDSGYRIYRMVLLLSVRLYLDLSPSFFVGCSGISLCVLSSLLICLYLESVQNTRKHPNLGFGVT